MATEAKEAQDKIEADKKAKADATAADSVKD